MQRWNPSVFRWNPDSRKIMGRWNPPVFRWNLIPAKNEPLESHPVRDFKIINTEGVGAGRGESAKPRAELSIVVKTFPQMGAVASSA